MAREQLGFPKYTPTRDFRDVIARLESTGLFIADTARPIGDKSRVIGDARTRYRPPEPALLETLPELPQHRTLLLMACELAVTMSGSASANAVAAMLADDAALARLEAHGRNGPDSSPMQLTRIVAMVGGRHGPTVRVRNLV